MTWLCTVPAATTATLRLRSLQTGSAGLLIDAVRIDSGPAPLPPSQTWANLATVADARGGRHLDNVGRRAAASLGARVIRRLD